MNVLKSTWFKCITCLLLIAVISGALLSVLNDVLYVSPEMRTARAIENIYGEKKIYYVILDPDEMTVGGNEDKNLPIEYDGVGRINKIYEIDNGDMLFQATGYHGYKNGTITLWIQSSIAYSVAEDGAKNRYSITKVLLETSEKQTLMSKLTGDYYDKFKLNDITEAYKAGNFFSATEKDAENYNPVSGATYSATAAANAVNCVIKYLGVQNEN